MRYWPDVQFTDTVPTVFRHSTDSAQTKDSVKHRILKKCSKTDYILGRYLKRGKKLVATGELNVAENSSWIIFKHKSVKGVNTSLR